MTRPKINWHAVGGIAFLACFWTVVVVIVIALCVGCAPTKIIDRTETLKIGMDSTQVVQLMNQRVQSVEQRMDSAMHAVTTQISPRSRCLSARYSAAVFPNSGPVSSLYSPLST